MTADPKPVSSQKHTYSKLRGARSGKVVTCDGPRCDKTFYKHPSKIGRRNFCSRDCACEGRVFPEQTAEVREAKRQKFLSRTGSKNPNYKNGRWTGKQDRELNRKFNLALKGEDCCRVCGSREYVQLHHAIPKSLGTKESRLNLLNGIPLCATHHQGWHRRSEYFMVYRDVFTSEEWAYLLSVEMSGRETRAWLADRYPLRST